MPMKVVTITLATERPHNDSCTYLRVRRGTIPGLLMGEILDALNDWRKY